MSYDNPEEYMMYLRLKKACEFVYPDNPKECEERIAAAKIRNQQSRYSTSHYLQVAYERLCAGEPA